VARLARAGADQQDAAGTETEDPRGARRDLCVTLAISGPASLACVMARAAIDAAEQELARREAGHD